MRNKILAYSSVAEESSGADYKKFSLPSSRWMRFFTTRSL